MKWQWGWRAPNYLFVIAESIFKLFEKIKGLYFYFYFDFKHINTAIDKFKCSQNSVISNKNLSPPKCNKCLVITISHKLRSTHILFLRRVIFKMLHLDNIEKEENQCSWWHNKK